MCTDVIYFQSAICSGFFVLLKIALNYTSCQIYQKFRNLAVSYFYLARKIAKRPQSTNFLYIYIV